MSKLEDTLISYNGPQKHIICSQLYYAYDFYELEDCVDQGIYQNLYNYLISIKNTTSKKPIIKEKTNKKTIKKFAIAILIIFIALIISLCISEDLFAIVFFIIIVSAPIIIFTLLVIKIFIIIRKRFKENKKKSIKTFFWILLFSIFACADILWIVTIIIELITW